MQPTFLVLCQFVLEGERYTSHMQIHHDDISSLYATLPYLYSVIFVKKNGAFVTPLGGLLVKSNIEKTDPTFRNKVLDLAHTLAPTSALAEKTNTFSVIPVNGHSTLPLKEGDCDRIATDTCTLVGNAGHA